MMTPRLYFGHLTLYDDDGKVYEIKKARFDRAIGEINKILQARGDGMTEILIRERRQ